MTTTVAPDEATAPDPADQAPTTEELAAALEAKRERRAELQRRSRELTSEISEARDAHGRAIAAGAPKAELTKLRNAARDLDEEAAGTTNAIEVLAGDIAQLERELTARETERLRQAAIEKATAADTATRTLLEELWRFAAERFAELRAAADAAESEAAAAYASVTQRLPRGAREWASPRRVHRAHVVNPALQEAIDALTKLADGPNVIVHALSGSAEPLIRMVARKRVSHRPDPAAPLILYEPGDVFLVTPAVAEPLIRDATAEISGGPRTLVEIDVVLAAKRTLQTNGREHLAQADASLQAPLRELAALERQPNTAQTREQIASARKVVEARERVRAEIEQHLEGFTQEIEELEAARHELVTHPAGSSGADPLAAESSA